MQGKDSSVQLVLKNGWKCKVKSDLGDNEYLPLSRKTHFVIAEIRGFMQGKDSSVQLVLKNGWKYKVKSDLGDNEYLPAEKLIWLLQRSEVPCNVSTHQCS